MATFDYETTLAAPAERVFDFLARPANIPLVSPRWPRVTVIEAPERLSTGAAFVVRVSVMGLGRRVTGSVLWFEEGRGFTDALVDSPLPRWEHTHILRPDGDKSHMTDRVLFEPPTGWLGWFLTERRIRARLRTLFAYRQQRFRELFGLPEL